MIKDLIKKWFMELIEQRPWSCLEALGINRLDRRVYALEEDKSGHLALKEIEMILEYLNLEFVQETESVIDRNTTRVRHDHEYKIITKLQKKKKK